MQTGVARGDQWDLRCAWGCQVLRSWTPSLFYRPVHVPKEQESHCRPCSCCTKKYSIQEFSSSVVCAVCLHNCETYSTVWLVHQFVYSSLSVCVCVFLFVLFKSKRHLLVTYSSLPASKSWQQRRCDHWQCAEWKTELCRSLSILL